MGTRHTSVLLHLPGMSKLSKSIHVGSQRSWYQTPSNPDVGALVAFCLLPLGHNGLAKSIAAILNGLVSF